jgi:hypothetical protein
VEPAARAPAHPPGVNKNPPARAAPRGTVGLVLIGLATFLLVLAPMLRWFAYPRLAVAPADMDRTLVSVGAATIFDIDDRAERDTVLTSTQVVRSDAASTNGEVAVWDSFVTTVDAEGTTVSTQTQRAAFDPHTGVAVPGFGENVDGEPVEHAGQVFTFPFGTEKRTYDVFDPTLAEARSAVYDGEDEIHGVGVYRFVQTIEPVAHTTVEAPGWMVGSPLATVTADRVYANVRTFWVEPETGVIINEKERMNSALQVDGGATLTIMEATTRYDDQTVAEAAGEYGGLADRLRLVRDTAPLAVGALGLAVMCGGLLVRWSATRGLGHEQIRRRLRRPVSTVPR